MATTPEDVYVVIVAGGTGTRLWPVSRKCRPKQFLSLVGKENFIQKVYSRAKKITSPENIFIVAPEHYSKFLTEYIPEFPLTNFMGEPAKKGTTAAYGYCAVYIKQLNPKAILHIIAADDYIRDEEKYAKALALATKQVSEGQGLVIYGVKPRNPYTGYGYVQVDLSSKVSGDASDLYTVTSFHEKPPLETAKQYLLSGDYFWHCFGFTVTVKQLLDLIETHDPDTHQVLLEIEADLKLPGRLESIALKAHYEKIKESNIENQILEKSSLKTSMITLEDEWGDVGTWDHVYEVMEKDENGNVIKGNQADIFSIDSQNNLLIMKNKPIALVGVKNLAVIDTEDVILICNLEKSQDVKKLVEYLKTNNLTKYL